MTAAPRTLTYATSFCRALLACCAAVLLLVPQTLAAPKARPVLEPLADCPPRMPACFAAEILPTAVDNQDIGRLPGRQNYPEGADIVRIAGRLNGGPKRTYGLVVWTSPMSCGGGGPAAYLGRSSRNNPIILTKSGELEVFGDDLAFGSVNATVIDERTGDTTELLDGYAGLDSFVFDSRGEAYLLSFRTDSKRRQREVCFKAPKTKAGRLQLAAGRCKRSDGTHGLVPQERASLHPNARVAKILDDMDALYGHELFAPYNRLWRVDGTHTLVIQASTPCT